MANVRITRQRPGAWQDAPLPPGTWHVYVDDVFAGRVRKTDGQWNASVWLLTGTVFRSRSLQSLGGNYRKRAEAIRDVVGAWIADNE